MDEHSLALDLGRTMAQIAASLRACQPPQALIPSPQTTITASTLPDHTAPIAGATATPPAPSPTPQQLHAVAQMLHAFAQRHRASFDFDGFPLPAAPGDALCSYELFRDADSGLTLYANALRGGIDSAVHEHGTWAVIVGVHGQERNRLYLRPAPGDTGQADTETDIHAGASADAAALPRFLREVCIDGAHPLVLDAALFHSIHTAADQPALQLHLYGQALDLVGERQAYELTSGRLTVLR